MFIVRGLLLKYMNRRSELMSAVSMNEAAKKIAQLENAKEVRPPGRCTAGRTPANKNLCLLTVPPYFTGREV